MVIMKITNDEEKAYMDYKKENDFQKFLERRTIKQRKKLKHPKFCYQLKKGTINLLIVLGIFLIFVTFGAFIYFFYSVISGQVIEDFMSTIIDWSMWGVIIREKPFFLLYGIIPFLFLLGLFGYFIIIAIPKLIEMLFSSIKINDDKKELEKWVVERRVEQKIRRMVFE